jgi:hypothetical protein
LYLIIFFIIIRAVFLQYQVWNVGFIWILLSGQICSHFNLAVIKRRAMDTSVIGNIGEEAVRDVLRTIKGTLVSGFIRSNNIVYYGKNFQLDFIVFVPKIGLVVIEVKKWKGTVKATSNDKWSQEVGNSCYASSFPRWSVLF